MKTLTATEARKNLTRWLKAAKDGQEVGIVYGADIFALRPVPVQAADYAQREYGVTDGQLQAFAARTGAELAAERRTGRMAVFRGRLPKRRAG
jgi:antitoxin (DNA-binding transcriptional repressor) of toxin-antitoxin stability system